jgi:hypothetical protein
MTPEIKKALDLAHGYLDRLIRGLNMDDTSEAVQVRDAIKQALAASTVQEPVATKLKTEQFNCFHVSAEDFKNLKALPVGTKLYTTPPAQPAPCTWTKSNDPHMPDTFDAACGVVWTFTDGGPVENDVRFCPGCGAAVNVATPEPEEDLFDLAVKADNGGQP